ASQPDAIQTADGVGAIHDGERRHVAAGAREPTQDGQSPDPHVLVHDAVPGHERLITHHDVPGHESAAADDGAVADTAVVSDVRVRHEVVVGAHDRQR